MEVLDLIFGEYVDLCYYKFGGEVYCSRIIYPFDDTSPFVVHNGIKLCICGETLC